MVLGIGEGKIDIVVGKTAFMRGETIGGKVVLTLNQPKQARGLRIALIAEREIWRHDARGHRTRHTETVFSSPLRLGEEKEYPAGQSTYDFSIAVPDLPMPTGTKVGLGPLSFTIGGAPPLKWRLESSLDLSMSFDINKKLPITVG
ncbi:MAG: hypothetical protein PHV13_02620 [Candidatus ainarchaeum sp.]|nr:hypothetical protein [Candidatus ainarchaeum sp.]